MRYQWFVRIEIWLAAIILPIMRIYTLGLIMFGQIEGTELSLIVKHVKIVILSVVVDQRRQDLLLTVGIGAEISIGTVGCAMRVMRAKLFLVLLQTVMLLNEGVSVDAAIAIRTLLFLLHEGAHLGVIKIPIAFPILGVVVIGTVFVIVRLGDVAWRDFEEIEVEMLHEDDVTLTVGVGWNW